MDFPRRNNCSNPPVHLPGYCAAALTLIAGCGQPKHSLYFKPTRRQLSQLGKTRNSINDDSIVDFHNTNQNWSGHGRARPRSELLATSAQPNLASPRPEAQNSILHIRVRASRLLRTKETRTMTTLPLPRLCRS